MNSIVGRFTFSDASKTCFYYTECGHRDIVEIAEGSAKYKLLSGVSGIQVERKRLLNENCFTRV